MKGWSEIKGRQDHTVGQLTLLAYRCTMSENKHYEEYIQCDACDRQSSESSVMALQKWLIGYSGLWIVFLLQTLGCVGKDSVTHTQQQMLSSVRKDNLDFWYVSYTSVFLLVAVLGIKPRALHTTGQELCHWAMSSARLHFQLCSQACGGPGLAHHRYQPCILYGCNRLIVCI